MSDLSILMKQVATAYSRADTSWTKCDVFNFFIIFYTEYESVIGIEHPRLRTDTIRRIIEKLHRDDTFSYYLDDYKEMIPKYFDTNFSKCDYSLAHFMSGRIRQMRYLETCI